MQDAAGRIRRGAAALKERSAQDDAHYRQVAELQRRWTVRRAAPPQDRFYVDLSLRPTLAEPNARALIDIVRVTSLPHRRRCASLRCLPSWRTSILLSLTTLHFASGTMYAYEYDCRRW